MIDYEIVRKNLEQFTHDTICQIAWRTHLFDDTEALKEFHKQPVFPDLLLYALVEGRGAVFNTKKNEAVSEIKVKNDKYGYYLYTKEGIRISFISSGLMGE